MARSKLIKAPKKNLRCSACDRILIDTNGQDMHTGWYYCSVDHSHRGSATGTFIDYEIAVCDTCNVNVQQLDFYCRGPQGL